MMMPSREPATMPSSFIAASDMHRLARIRELEQEAARCAATRASDWPVTFKGGEAAFDQAIKTAVALDTSSRSTVETLESVTFRPYPSKSEGAWRVEVEFKRGQGMFAGAEWYVSQEQLWATWEASA